MDYPYYVKRANSSANYLALNIIEGEGGNIQLPGGGGATGRPGSVYDPVDAGGIVYHEDYIAPATGTVFSPTGGVAGVPAPVPNVVVPPVIIAAPINIKKDYTPASLDFLKPAVDTIKKTGGIIGMPVPTWAKPPTPPPEKPKEGLDKYLTKRNLLVGGGVLLGLKLLKII